MGVGLAQSDVNMDKFYNWYFGDRWEENCLNLQRLNDIKPEGKDTGLVAFLKKLTKAKDVVELANDLFENQGDKF